MMGQTVPPSRLNSPSGAGTLSTTEFPAASIEILNQLSRFNAARGGEPTRIGIGLHAGDAVTGTIGSAQRREYTIVGDTVNVAKRIEQLNKSLGSRLLVSERVWNGLDSKPRVAKKVGRVRVKGHEAPILLYEVAWRGRRPAESLRPLDLNALMPVPCQGQHPPL